MVIYAHINCGSNSTRSLTENTAKTPDDFVTVDLATRQLVHFRPAMADDGGYSANADDRARSSADAAAEGRGATPKGKWAGRAFCGEASGTWPGTSEPVTLRATCNMRRLRGV